MQKTSVVTWGEGDWTGSVMFWKRIQRMTVLWHLDGRLRGKGTGAVQKTTWRRMVEVERNNAGWNSWNAAGRAVQTGINGKTMSKPYVPSSTEWIKIKARFLSLIGLFWMQLYFFKKDGTKEWDVYTIKKIYYWYITYFTWLKYTLAKYTLYDLLKYRCPKKSYYNAYFLVH